MNIKVYTKRVPNNETSIKSLEPLYHAYDAAWRTKWELAIIRNSARIRSEPDWMARLEVEDKVKQWVDNLKSLPDLLEEHIDYLIAELRYFAKLQRANIASGTMLSAVDMVWTMDIPENDTLAHEFKRHVVGILETNHYNLQVIPISGYLKLIANSSSDYNDYLFINPSLYALTFDMTSLLDCPIKSSLDALNLPSYGRVPGSHAAWKQAIHKLNQRMASNNDFVPINEEYLDKLDPNDRHWLPTDIYVNNDGTVEFKSYINSIHPGKYPEAYTSIGKIISKCLPALEQVLTDWKHQRDLRIPYDPDECVYKKMLRLDEYYSLFNESPESDYNIVERKWWYGTLISPPLPPAFSEPTRPLIPHSLRNKDLQVVVKMDDADIHLDNWSRYFGWDADGTASEQIIATAVYYYEVDSPTDLFLSFRESISGDGLVSDLKLEQAINLLEIDRERTTNASFSQRVGKIKIKPGLIVCYPNVYQHSFQDDYHEDRSEPSRIKALTLYFVDPSIRIISTSVVPPQQKEWWADKVLQTPLMRSLPWFVQDQIIKDVDMPMSLNQASENRKQLDKKSFEQRFTLPVSQLYSFFSIRIHTSDD